MEIAVTGGGVGERYLLNRDANINSLDIQHMG